MPEHDGFTPVRLGTDGAVEARWYSAEYARAAVLLFGGTGGGFDSPAAGLYARLGRHLPADSIAVLRVRFRYPGDLAASVGDVLSGVDWVRAQGVERVGLVGHSFGGAVAIGAAAERAGTVLAVVALSTQSSGTGAISRLRDLPVLLLHGSDDEVLPPACSEQVFGRAGTRSRLQLIPGARHVLDEAADEVYRLTHGWLADHLA